MTALPSDSITIYEEPEVKFLASMGGDESVVTAARVSVVGENFQQEDLDVRDAGLINYLLREKHGSPFEHNALKFFVKAPIMVFREFHRHRIGFSYNEMSGRYTKLPPEFYSPSQDRPLINVGTSAKPEFAPAPQELWEWLIEDDLEIFEFLWARYERRLEKGIANEIARDILPLGIMSQMYVTCNARSLMSFLSLRTKDERAAHLSRPQYEIEQVARIMEDVFAQQFPVTYAAYNKYGRVAP